MLSYSWVLQQFILIGIVTNLAFGILSTSSKCGDKVSIMCKNGGSCFRDRATSSYSCHCPMAYYGRFCELLDPCQQQGQSIKCEDPNQTCQVSAAGHVVCFPNPCSSSPCLFNGNCEEFENGTDFVCICPRNRFGRICESAVIEIECPSGVQPCLNGGRCFSLNIRQNETWCQCATGYTGKNCGTIAKIKHPYGFISLEASDQLKVFTTPNPISNSVEDPCITIFKDSCKNNGTCTQYGDFDFYCKCPKGWIGKQCDFRISYDHPAVLETVEEQFDEDFSGIRGRGINSIPVPVMDPCSSGPCLHNGLCTAVGPNNESAACDCPREYLGMFCESRNPCALGGNDQCKNGGTCQRMSDIEFECRCRSPFRGDHCEILDLCLVDVGECIDDLKPQPNCYPCQPEAHCNQISQFRYSCMDNASTTTPITLTSSLPYAGERRGALVLVEDYQEDRIAPIFNQLIPIVILSLLVLYALALAVFIPIDKSSETRPTLIIVGDIRRISTDTFYLLTIQTGNSFFAGTTGRIYCEIVGEFGQTRVIVVNNYLMRSMKQNDDIDFLISTPQPLGQLHTIQFWFDLDDRSNSTYRPSWFCRNVFVRDIKTEQIWFFFISKWLTFELGGTVGIEAKTANDKEVLDYCLYRSFRWSEYWRQLREHHIWCNMFTAPSKSAYTRAERVATAFTLEFTSMFLAMVMYGLSDDQHHLLPKKYLQEIKFSQYDPIFSIGTKASLAGLAVAYVVTILFRFIKRQLIPVLIVWGNLRDTTPITTSSPTTAASAIKKSSQAFRIPSTDMLETEDWLYGVKVDPKNVVSTISSEHPYDDGYVSTYNSRVEACRCDSFLKNWYDGFDQNSRLHPEPLLLRRPQSSKFPRSVTVRNPEDMAKLSYLSEALSRNRPPKAAASASLLPRDSSEPHRHYIEPTLHGDSKSADALTVKKLSSRKHIDDRIKASSNTSSAVLPSNSASLARKLELCAMEYTLYPYHCLPRYFVWIGWGICLTLIIIFASLLFYHGFRFSRSKSYNWLASVVWALAESIFVLQPLIILIAYLVMIYLGRRNNMYSKKVNIKLRFKLLCIVGDILPLVIWPLYYLIHPLRVNDDHEISPDVCPYPFGQGKPVFRTYPAEEATSEPVIRYQQSPTPPSTSSEPKFTKPPPETDNIK